MSIESSFAENIGELPIKVGDFELTAQFIEDNASLNLDMINDDYYRYFKEIIQDTDRISSNGGDIYRYILFSSDAFVYTKTGDIRYGIACKNYSTNKPNLGLSKG